MIFTSWFFEKVLLFISILGIEMVDFNLLPLVIMHWWKMHLEGDFFGLLRLFGIAMSLHVLKIHLKILRSFYLKNSFFECWKQWLYLS